MKNIKKIIVSIFCIMLLVLPISQSHAMLGGAGSVFTVASALYLGGGVGTIGGSLILGQEAKERCDSQAEKVGITILQAIGVIVGIFLMDENDGEISFGKLDGSLADDLGISDFERGIYNSELDELNAVCESVEAQLIEENSKNNIERAQEILINYKGLLDEVTLMVASKLSGVLVVNSKR